MKQWKTALFWFVIAANLVGVAYGMTFYYGAQLLQTAANNPLLLPFVPDSPFATLFITAALLLAYYKRSMPLFAFFASTLAFKIGLWTTYVILGFPEFYLAPSIFAVQVILLIAHIGLFLEPFLLPGTFAPRPWHVAVTLAVFLFADWIDYAFSVHPPMPLGAIGTIASATALLSLLSVGLAWVVFTRMKKPLLELVPQTARLK